MANDFAHQRDDELRAGADHTVAALVGMPELPLTPGQREALASAVQDFAEAQFAAFSTRAAAEAATTAKEAAREALVAALGSVASSLYPSPEVPDGALLRLGFAPRPARTTRPRRAETVTGLFADPMIDGTVRLRWDKGANPRGAIYQIEGRTATGGWTILTSTTRASLTLLGYAPGVEAWFRVMALTSMGAALPSAPASIYHGSGAAARRAA